MRLTVWAAVNLTIIAYSSIFQNSAGAQISQTKQFQSPRFIQGGKPVSAGDFPVYYDFCQGETEAGYETGCGAPSANSFCRRQGFSAARDFDWAWSSSNIMTYKSFDKMFYFGGNSGDRSGKSPRRIFDYITCSY